MMIGFCGLEGGYNWVRRSFRFVNSKNMLSQDREDHLQFVCKKYQVDHVVKVVHTYVLITEIDTY